MAQQRKLSGKELLYALEQTIDKMTAASAAIANVIASGGLLMLGYRSAKALHAPVVVAIDRLEDRLQQSQPPTSAGTRRRRQTMTPAQAVQLYSSAERQTQDLLKAWVLFGLLSVACALHLPYAPELRSVLVILAVLSAGPTGAGAARGWIESAFRSVGPPVLGKGVPRALRWLRRQARGALWWVSPLTRSSASMMVQPATIAFLSDADLILLANRLVACRQALAPALQASEAALPRNEAAAGGRPQSRIDRPPHPPSSTSNRSPSPVLPTSPLELEPSDDETDAHDFDASAGPGRRGIPAAAGQRMSTTGHHHSGFDDASGPADTAYPFISPRRLGARVSDVFGSMVGRAAKRVPSFFGGGGSAEEAMKQE